MSYRQEFRKAEAQFFWTLPRLIVALVALLGGFGLGIWGLGVLSQPAQIAAKTLDANNAIDNYEWFHDAYGNYQARVAQFRQFKGLLVNESDPAEKSRLRIETAAIQQACRDLAQRYNANADKTNRNIFMGRDVPLSLDAVACE